MNYVANKLVFICIVLLPALSICMMYASENLQENENVAVAHDESPSVHEQFQEIQAALVAMQLKLDTLTQETIDNLKVITEKEKSCCKGTIACDLAKFLAEHSLTIVSTACALIGLYLSYESLKISTASFVIDKGDVAINNIDMIARGRYSQYKALLESSKLTSKAATLPS